MTSLLLEYCKAVDRKIWPHLHPLRQFDRDLSPEVAIRHDLLLPYCVSLVFEI